MRIYPYTDRVKVVASAEEVEAVKAVAGINLLKEDGNTLYIKAGKAELYDVILTLCEKYDIEII